MHLAEYHTCKTTNLRHHPSQYKNKIKRTCYHLPRQHSLILYHMINFFYYSVTYLLYTMLNNQIVQNYVKCPHSSWKMKLILQCGRCRKLVYVYLLEKTSFKFISSTLTLSDYKTIRNPYPEVKGFSWVDIFTSILSQKKNSNIL